MRLIDADALKEYIGGVRATYNCFDEDERPRYEAHSKAIYLLDCYLQDAPTIEAEPVRKGKWVRDYKAICSGKEWTCSECGRLEFGDEEYLAKFCPNCGADMGGAEDE